MLNKDISLPYALFESAISNLEAIQIKSLQTKLQSEGIVNITSCFNPLIRELLIQETLELFEKSSKRKDFFSKHTQTPRHMYTVSEVDIAKDSKIIKDFYYSESVVKLLTELAQEKIDYLPWTGERFVINGLINNQDTHGWHWDDYAYALVFIADAPPKHAGGEVECVAHTHWDKANPNIQQIVATHGAQSHYFNVGELYLMKSDTTLHRVTKIISPYQRLSIAMSYCNQSDLTKNIDHATVLDLYG